MDGSAHPVPDVPINTARTDMKVDRPQKKVRFEIVVRINNEIKDVVARIARLEGKAQNTVILELLEKAYGRAPHQWSDEV